MFGDYMNPDAEPEERVYGEVKSLDEMYKIVELCLEEYNNTHKNRMNLVIFRYNGLIFLSIELSCDQNVKCKFTVLGNNLQTFAVIISWCFLC